MISLCSIPDCSKTVRARGLCAAHYARWWLHGNPLAGRTPNGTPISWLQNHTTHVGKECLTWPFAIGQLGYGIVVFEGVRMNASRAMCILAHGQPPKPNYDSAHSCGKGHLACVNPEHLSWKTRKSNHADKIVHGTTNRGEKSSLSKLTREQVIEIRKSNQEPHRELAIKFGVSKQTISDIQRRKSWNWL